VQGAFTTIQAVTRTGGGVCHCQFLPRMVAVAVTLLPVLWAPFAFNLIALTVDGGCCALFSLPAYRHLVRSDWLRVGCCALFAATLCAGSELIGTLTNMPWYLALAAVGAVALRSESVAEMRGRHLLWIATGAALCAASSPVVMVAAPVALWKAWRAIGGRTWKTIAIPAALLGGILIQGLVDFTLRHTTGGATAALLPNLPLALLFPGILRSMLGERLAMFLADHSMWTAAIGVSSLFRRLAGYAVAPAAGLHPTLRSANDRWPGGLGHRRPAYCLGHLDPRTGVGRTAILSAAGLRLHLSGRRVARHFSSLQVFARRPAAAVHLWNNRQFPRSTLSGYELAKPGVPGT